MWHKKIITVFAVLIPLSVYGQMLDYTETTPTFETGARFALGLEKDIIPNTLTLSLDEQLRVNDNFSHFQRSYTSAGLDYKIAPWLKAGLSYSLIANNSTSNGWGLRHRGAFALTETVKSGRLKVAFREKIQATYKGGSVNLYQSPQTSWALKTRAKVSYNLPASHFTPYLSAESRVLLNGVNPAYFVFNSSKGRWSNPNPKYNDVYFNRLRLNVGSTYKTVNKNTLDFFVVADFCYDLDIDFSSKGNQKEDSSYSSGYAPYLYLTDSYFVGLGIAYKFKL